MATSEAEENDSSSKADPRKEDIMDLVRGEGPWQTWIFLVSCMLNFPDSANNLAITFFAPNINYWCTRPPDFNASIEEWKKIAIPPIDSQCSSFGRRKIIGICNIITLVAALSCAFSTSFFMFAVARFFVAVGATGANCTSFVLLMEVVGPKRRSEYGIGVIIGWLAGHFGLAGFAWWFRDWFWVQIAITLPSIFLLSCWWLIPESPRWLLTHGKPDAALKVLSRAGKKNGLNPVDIEPKLKEIISQTSKAHKTENASANFFQLLKLGLWRKTLIICFTWCVIAFVYYGLTYNTNELAGDPFVNFIASGLAEIPADILAVVVIKSKGRRNPLAISLAAAGASCLLMYPIPDDPWWLSATLSLFGKSCIGCAFCIIWLYTAEVFPTVVRNVSLGAASTSARIGMIVAPFVKEVGRATHPVVPQIIFGILATTSGFLVLLLPETNKCSVPDTVKEAAAITR